MEKNAQIKETLKATRDRHSQMDCKVFECKVVKSSMSKTQRNETNQLFKEAKWFRNDIVASDNIFSYSDKTSTVSVKIKDNFEDRKLELLGSGIRQGILSKVKAEIKGLSTKKKKGNYSQVGTLKFKSVCNAVPLKQYKNTYDINFDKNRIRVQGIKTSFYVKGLKQIKPDYEVCNAEFIRKASGLYFHIICFVPKEEVKSTGQNIGLDFGIEHTINYSDGRTYDCKADIDKKIKLASRRFNRAYSKNLKLGMSKSEAKKTKNHFKRKQKVQIAYEKLSDKKKDSAYKEINRLKSNYDLIAIQDEMIKAWHSGIFGRQVQMSNMGFIKAALKNNAKTYVVETSYPSTQICPECGCLTKHPLGKRDYDCPYCGYHHNSRDQKSAQSILDEAIRQVSMERRAQSLVETESSTLKGIIPDVSKILSVKQESSYASA